MSHLQFNCNRAVWQAASFIWEMMFFGFCHQVRFRITIWREHKPPFKNPAFSSLDPGKKSLHDTSRLFITFYRNVNSSKDFPQGKCNQYTKLDIIEHITNSLKKKCSLNLKNLPDKLIKSLKIFQHSFTRFYKTHNQWQFYKLTKLWKRQIFSPYMLHVHEKIENCFP